MTPEQMVDFFKNEPVDNAPGEKFEYNNSGYVVLGYIIELTSGVAYEDFIKQKIFDEIEMTNSYFASDRKVMKNRAYAHHPHRAGSAHAAFVHFVVLFSHESTM